MCVYGRCVYVFMYVCTCMYVCMYVCAYVCVCMYVYMYVFIYYVCMFVCMCVYSNVSIIEHNNGCTTPLFQILLTAQARSRLRQ